MKKKIKLTESDLHNIINRTVRKVLKEGVEGNESVEGNEDNEIRQQLTDIRKQLAAIMESGFIPFSSPAPSSSEQCVKKALIKADCLIGYAMNMCKRLGYFNC